MDRYVWSVSSHPETDGLAWFSDWGSLRYAVNAAFAAALYAESTGDDDAADFALSQLAYVMGENDHDRSFVVGFGCNPPTEPHHANAYGHEALDWDLDREFRYSLDGAMVGGPTQGDYVYGGKTVTSPGYEDEITDFIGNEVTITYNGGLVGLAAYGLSTGKN